MSGSKASLRRVFSIAIDSVNCRRLVDSALRPACPASLRGRKLPGHNLSKARNQTRVQPVGLGDEAFSLGKALIRLGLTIKTVTSASISAAVSFRA